MLRILFLCAVAIFWNSATTAQVTGNGSGSEDVGVLLMAHGGSEEWNAGVLAAVEPLRGDYPIEVAFGMADAVSLQEAVTTLEKAGADRIAVVRLFISGDSWFERTQQILGMLDGAPERPTHAAHEDNTGSANHTMEFWKVDAEASFAISVEGLAEAPEMSGVIVDRARALSKDPIREDVLIFAHGPEDDDENLRWLEYLEAHAEHVRKSMSFHEVRVETLREDWPEKREIAEEQIREFVSAAAENGRRAIVIPFRVHGFGPYADVLDGLDYVSDGQGLVPHPLVTDWLRRQIVFLVTEGLQ